MHPDIFRFPSLEFYNLGVLDGTVDKIGHTIPMLLPPASKYLKPDSDSNSQLCLAFVDHREREQVKHDNCFNLTDAYIALDIIRDLLLKNEVRPLLLVYKSAELYSDFY